MKDLETRSYYNLKTPEQWALYDVAEDALMWKKLFGRIAALFLLFFVGMCLIYSHDRTRHEAEVERANARVLKMVEQLKPNR